MLPLGRLQAPAHLRGGAAGRRRLARKAYLISSEDDASASALKRSVMHDGVQIVGLSFMRPGWLDENADHSGLGRYCATLAADIRVAFEGSSFSEIYIRHPRCREAELQALMHALAPFPVRIVLLEDLGAHAERSPSPASDTTLAGYRVLELRRPPISAEGLAAKRAVDIIVASLALLVLLPIVAMACAAIAIETGRPIIFRQSRRGAGGKQFTIFKLRTMNVLENGSSIVQARRNDPRVTPLGAVFRRTSIDELPQFWNVLRGDMSIVGPRPHALAHDAYYGSMIEEYARRHNVKPGLTGWAQVNGLRGETRDLQAMAERIRHDIWYIENWSLWLDIKIIIKTAGCVFFQKEAY
jgi:exopolysaccharide biosynthesis polyprenyl glycosylphosphotransferase